MEDDSMDINEKVRLVQKKEVELLKIFSDICEKNRLFIQ